MFKLILLNLYTYSLIFGFTACSSAAANQPGPAPVALAEAASRDEMTEPPVVKEESAVVAGEAVAKVEESTKTAEVQERAQADDPAPALIEERATAAAAPMAQPEAVPVVEEPVIKSKPAPIEVETVPQAASPAQLGPSEAQVQLLASLANQGIPPELFNEVWLNSEPLKLADLQGKVVIVEFWTFGCINCKHVVPSLREWHQKYSAEGLVIIGVHTPEFSHEQEIENVKQALIDQDIPYPVAIDNDWKTWRAYNNRYWPAKYFIDKAGHLRHIHIGEGRYEQQEEIIQALLAEQVS